jgi:hypothetical protein
MQPAPEPLSHFELTTVVPGVAVSIQLGALPRYW